MTTLMVYNKGLIYTITTQTGYSRTGGMRAWVGSSLLSERTFEKMWYIDNYNGGRNPRYISKNSRGTRHQFLLTTDQPEVRPEK